MWREQAKIEWSHRVISIVACCHGAKLCAHAARDFRLQQNGAMTRMWRSCGMQPWHKERAIGAVPCKKEGMLLQPLSGVALIMWFTTNGMCVKNNIIMYVARTNNNRVISSGDLYCCLLPRCGALRTCRSGFPIVTVPTGYLTFSLKKPAPNLSDFLLGQSAVIKLNIAAKTIHIKFVQFSCTRHAQKHWQHGEG